MKKYLQIMFCFVFLLLGTSFGKQNDVRSQSSPSGEISGVVTDQTTNEPLPYATVVIKGTVVGAVTDLYGNFRFSNLAQGEYTLKISYTGYSPKEIPVSLNAGEKKKISVALDQPMLAIGEVVVSSQRMGQNAAINQQLNSDALVNVVSKDAIRSLPDVNAAEAIGRLPGVSLVRSNGEGSKVVLRGLDPKFSNISINGVAQPSTDISSNGERSVDLSNISPELLSGIEIYKSPTADMDADAIAGTINLVIARAPDQPKNQARVYGGYSDLHQKFGNFKGSWDYSSRFLDKKLGIMAQANYERTDRSSQSLNTSYFDPDSEVADSFFVSDVTLSDRKQITKRFGGLLMADYQFGFGGIYMTNMYNSSPRESYTQAQTIYRTGEIATNATVLEDKSNSFNSTLGGNFNLSKLKIDWSATRVKSNIYNPYEMQLRFDMGAPYGLNDEAVGASEKDPAYFINNLRFNNNNKDTLSYLYRAYVSPDTLKQTNYSAKLDLELPVKFGDKIAGFFKFGGKYQSEERERNVIRYIDQQYYLKPALSTLAQSLEPDRKLDLTKAGLIEMSNFNDQSGISMMGGDYNLFPSIPEDQVRGWYTNHFHPGSVASNTEFTQNNDNLEQNYDSRETVTAAYAMFKLNYGDLISFVPGIRYEYSHNIYHCFYSTINGDFGQNGYAVPDSSSQNYHEWLPSAHLKIKPVEWMDIRLSVAKTLSRPNYMWVIPRFRYNCLSNTVAKANPDLKHATAINYDASVTIYTGKFGLFTFGGYAKQINNMFYAISGTLSSEEAVLNGLPPQSFTLNEDYINLDNSWVRGLEFEYNTHFNYLPSPFNRFTLGLNFTRLWSETSYLVWNKIEGIVMYKDVRPTMAVDFDKSYFAETKSRMPSQVDYTTNAWLGYEFKGFSGRLSMAYQGTRLTGINTTSNKIGYNTYTDSYLRFDATAKQRINKFVSVLLNLNNITNAAEKGYRYRSNYLTYKNIYGFSIDLGLELNF
ncbi:MAG TPA: TonB-dependent receptor [Bacteroidales bacterium]|nr:TonB-dependent receptor [Bacteroidales bacterium]